MDSFADCTSRAPQRAWIDVRHALLVLCAVLSTFAYGGPPQVDEIVVKLRSAAAASPLDADARHRIGMALALGFGEAGQTPDGAHRLTLTPPPDIDVARAALNRLRLDPDVLYASVATRPLSGASAPAAFALPTDRIIVKFREGVASRDTQSRVDRVSAAAGAPLAFVRPMHDAASVLRIGRQASLAEVEAMAARIASDPDVEFAQPDYKRQIQIQPADPCYAKQALAQCANGYQWDLFEPAGGINADKAWSLTTGSAQIVVGVLDTGALYGHPDLASRLVPGYDMIDDALTANDNDPSPMCAEDTLNGCFGSRDADATDPGNWVTQVQWASSSNWFHLCPWTASSFHGSHVAGTIGAAAGNASGIVGINWASRIQPVRVIGRCGGYVSDVADAIVWSSGGAVTGAPPNPTPARVINLSLGGFSQDRTCDRASQKAITSALSRNTVVVVSAGNNNFDAGYASPANCSGVITAAATGQKGYKARYSNFGPMIEIAAPGGDSGFDPIFNLNRLGILSAINRGQQVAITINPPVMGAGPPDPDAHAYAQYEGTSMAAPHVTGVVSLMLSVNPALTPSQVASKLASSARPFPTGAPACNTSNDPLTSPLPFAQWKLCTCTTALCGAGIVDAAAAVNASLPPLGSATVVRNPYGPLSVSGATLAGNLVTGFQPNATIQLGGTPGAPGSFLQIDVAGLTMAANTLLTIRSGAAAQSVLLVGSNASASTLAGSIVAASGGPGIAPPMLMIRNADGIAVPASGSITAPNGLSLSALGATPTTGQALVVVGAINGGPSLQLRGASITGDAPLTGNNVFLGTFGNAHNPANGAFFLQNGLQLHPATGVDVALTLNGYGAAPQVFNVMVNGNATVALSSAGTTGAPPNNAPVMPGTTRAPGQAAPAYGGGSMIVQASGSMKLAGGASNDFIFPGAIVLKAGTTLDLNGVALNQGWTTSGQAFQGVFFEAPVIESTLPGVTVYGNQLNWINFSTLPQTPVKTFTLAQNADGSASFAPADAFAPHRNTYSATIDAAAKGACWTCLVNPTPIVVYP